MAILAGMSHRRDAQKNVSLNCGIDSVSGDIFPFLRDPVTGGMLVAGTFSTGITAPPTQGVFGTWTGGASATQIIASNVNTRGAFLKNTGTVPVYIGTAMVTGSTNGIILNPGDTLQLFGSYAIYGFGNTGTIAWAQEIT